MSMDAAAAAATHSRSDGFFKDASGRTLFYPFGESWRGYVVPDATREAALRAAVSRYRAIAPRFRVWPALLAGLSFCGAWVLLDIHPFWALAALVLPLVLFVLVDRCLLQYQIRDLLSGLERADRRDAMPAYLRQAALAAAALALVTEQLYQNRIGALPTAAGSTSYYADVAQPLVWTLLLGCFAIVTDMVRHKLPEAFGANKLLLVMLLCVVIQGGCVGYVALQFFDPRPSVVVSTDRLTCGWQVNWSDVTNVSLAGGGNRRALEYAALRIGSAPESIWSLDDIRRCQISGLNEDYSKVYRDIRSAWLATRRGPDNRSGDARLDQIDVGATRQEVINVFGAPTLPTRTADGDLLLYYDFDANDAAPQTDRQVTAIYFGDDGRVERLARYSVKDGKIVDSVSGKYLTGGSEYLFLETILFAKPHKG